jgi:hypothetical protein
VLHFSEFCLPNWQDWVGEKGRDYGLKQLDWKPGGDPKAGVGGNLPTYRTLYEQQRERQANILDNFWRVAWRMEYANYCQGICLPFLFFALFVPSRFTGI